MLVSAVKFTYRACLLIRCQVSRAFRRGIVGKYAISGLSVFLCADSAIFVDNFEHNMTKSKSKSKKSEKGKESNNSTNASDNRVSNCSHFM